MQIAKNISQMHSGRILGIEPNIEKLPSGVDKIKLVDLSVAIQEADIHVVLVDHKEFKGKRFDAKFIIDTKGIWT